MTFMGTYTDHTLCGGCVVVIPTLSRFYSLRFILSLVVLWLVTIRVLSLHEKVSSMTNKLLFWKRKGIFFGTF